MMFSLSLWRIVLFYFWFLVKILVYYISRVIKKTLPACGVRNMHSSPPLLCGDTFQDPQCVPETLVVRSPGCTAHASLFS